MTDELLDLLAVDPISGRRAAQRIVVELKDPLQLAFAHRALGVDARDSGRSGEALAHLDRAVEYARQTSDPEVMADVRATRAGTLIVLGKHRAGLREFGLAIEDARGLLLATILYRRGVCRVILKGARDAIDDFRASREILENHPESPWLANSLEMLGECEARLGRLDAAEQCLAECHALLGDDAGYESIRLGMMQAWLAFLRGDLPAALAMFDRYELSSIEDGRLRAEATQDKATIYLAAGLVDEAISVLSTLELATVPTTAAARSRALLARALVEAGQDASARPIAAAAAADLKGMGMAVDAAEAALTHLEARVTAAEGELPREAERVAARLVEVGSRRVVDGLILAGQLNIARSTERAIEHFAAAADLRGDGDRLVAASGWLGRANELALRGDPGVSRACAGGLDALDEYRAIMGSSEVHAALTHRGRDLARLALRHVVGDSRALLSWSERWRATALEKRPVTPHGEVSPALAMLRDSGRRIAEARAAGESTEALEKERRSLERKVRAEHHQQRAESQAEKKRFDPAELVARVGDSAFVELVDVDGTLHVLVVSRGRVRRVVAGETTKALELAEAGRFALRRAARTSRFNPGDLGERLQEAVLGNAVRMLPDGPVTISPTAALHGAPFALMPALSARPFSVVPSAAQWMRATAVPKPRSKRRALVSGPGLLTGGAEVGRLAVAYPDSVVLRDAHATVEATMKAIDGVRLAHLATHGTFRADSPLFSALELADGPLSVYELERLKRAPYRTILSACDSGVLAPVGAQEVLGLASALFSLGSAGLLCSIAEVNDEVTADLMMQVHASLEEGHTPADALAKVRAGTPVEQATAAAFVALGV